MWSAKVYDRQGTTSVGPTVERNVLGIGTEADGTLSIVLNKDGEGESRVIELSPDVTNHLLQTLESRYTVQCIPFEEE